MKNSNNELISTNTLNLNENKVPRLSKLIWCMLYENILLFGIIFITALVYGVVLNQKHGLHHRLGLQITIFVVLGIYFVTCWHTTGQTLAMKTWHLQLKDNISQKTQLSLTKAVVRYILGFLVWVMPSIIVSSIVNVPVLDIPLIISNIVLVFILAKLSTHKQFLHDKFLQIKFIDIK